jgi:poly(A) polymerase
MMDAALHIIRTLVDAGHEAYFAGGGVRDMLREQEPKDIDIATSAPPDEVQHLFEKTNAVGAHFGVIRVLLGDFEFEVATFRVDIGYSDGRHPDMVRFVTAREDVLRRDFTINGLLYDPLHDMVLDFVGGQRDLERKILRCIGEPERRFQEDKLRMMRAVRFAAGMELHIDQPTRRALQENARHILNVSIERIRDELTGILMGPYPQLGIQLLIETGLARQFIPEVADMQGIPQPPEFHPEGDVLTHVLLMLEMMKEPTITLALAVLLHDIGKPETLAIRERIRFDNHVQVGMEMTREILVRLHYSNEIIDRVATLVRYHLHYKDVQNMRPSTLKRFLSLDHFDEHLALHRLDCLSSHRNLDSYQFCLDKIAEFGAEPLIPPPLITGDDLIADGYTPGPQFKLMLQAVQDAQLEENITTREEALGLVRDQYPRT